MKKRIVFAIVTAMVLLAAACNSIVTESPLAAASGSKEINGYKVVAYQPNYSYRPDSLQWDKITHLIYSFGKPDAVNGALVSIDFDKLSNMSTRAKQHGVKVLIGVGGWDLGDGGGVDTRFHTVASSDTLRAAFVQSCIDILEQYDVDGIDIDWEHPNTAEEKESYAVFMRDLSVGLHAKGKLLTTALGGGGHALDYVKDEVFGYVDFINIMAYDASKDNHSPFSYTESALNAYVVERNLPLSKAIIGVPFYGRVSWSDAKTYKQLIDMGASSQEDYYNGYYYNGIPTIKGKTQYAMRRNIGGVMIWEVGQDTYDDTSLLSAIHDVLSGGVVATFTPTPTPQPCSLAPWEPGKIYLGGDKCHYNNADWEAQWWVNVEPGTSNAWKQIRECSGTTQGGDSTSTPTPTITVPPTTTPTGTPTPEITPSPTPEVTPTPTTTPQNTPTPTATADTGGYPEWTLNASYTVGDIVTYQGSNYKALVTHTAYVQSWNPKDAVTLWTKL